MLDGFFGEMGLGPGCHVRWSRQAQGEVWSSFEQGSLACKSWGHFWFEMRLWDGLRDEALVGVSGLTPDFTGTLKDREGLEDSNIQSPHHIAASSKFRLVVALESQCT